MLAGLSDVVLRRFPELTSWRIQFADGPSSPIPPYLGLILAALESPLEAPLCFVLPRVGSVPQIALFLHALHRLVVAYDATAQREALGRFAVGDRVRVNPTGEVYIFGGPAQEYPGMVWLRTGVGNNRRTFPVAELNRLEKTQHPAPLGPLQGDLGHPPTHPLDKLIDRQGYGSTAPLQGSLLMLDGKGEFEAFSESVKFLRSPLLEDLPPIGSLLPIGGLSDSRRSRRIGKAHSAPAIIQTYDIQALAEECLEAPRRSQLIVVNGLSRIRGQLQSYDDIAATQRLALFADHDESDLFGMLADRGCRFWPLTHGEIQSPEQALTGAFELVDRCARHLRDLDLRYESCANPQLEQAFFWLDSLKDLIGKVDEGPASRLLSQMWWLFLDASRRVDDAQTEASLQFAMNLDELLNSLRANRSAISLDAEMACKEFIDAIRPCGREGSRLGESKGAVLFHALDRAISKGSSAALLADSVRSLKHLGQWLHRHPGLRQVELFAPRTCPRDRVFDELVFAAWPGGDDMRKVVSGLSSAVVTLVGYPWEGNWLKQSLPRLKPRQPRTALTGAEKSAIVFLDTSAERLWPLAPAPPPPVPQVAFDIIEFERQLSSVRIGAAAHAPDSEDTVSARYLRFSGNFYAFLTDGHKVAVATSLLDRKAGSAHGRLPEGTVDTIVVGDLIVFPASGDRELLAEIADKLIGVEAPHLRRTARLWKAALRESSLTPEQFCRRAEENGHRKHLATVRHWFAETSQIGPRDESDLALISLVTGNGPLKSAGERVLQAIERVRSAHQQAGLRLRDQLIETLPNVIGRIEDERTHISLGELGSAWIVRLEGIDPRPEPRSRGEVNRLMEATLFSPFPSVT